MAERVATIYDYARFTRALCGKGSSCFHCPLGIDNNGEKVICSMLITNHTDKANELIIKWCDENPLKTYKADFLEKFPNSTESNIYAVAKCRIYDNADRCIRMENTCKDCWNEVFPE